MFSKKYQFRKAFLGATLTVCDTVECNFEIVRCYEVGITILESLARGTPAYLCRGSGPMGPDRLHGRAALKISRKYKKESVLLGVGIQNIEISKKEIVFKGFQRKIAILRGAFRGDPHRLRYC